MDHQRVSKLPWRATRNWILVAVVFVVSALPLVAAGASAAAEARLEYADALGELNVRDGEGDAVLPVELGMKVPLGGLLHTRRTTAELILEPDHAILRVARDTTVHLRGLSKRRRGRTLLRLDEGSLRSIVEPLRGLKRFEVQTPSAVVGVRGTDFRIDIDPGVRETVIVFDGVVEVRRDDGETTTLTTGQTVDLLDPDLSVQDLDDGELEELDEESEPDELDPEDVESEEERDDGDDDGDDDAAAGGSDSGTDGGDSADSGSSGGSTSGGDSDSGDSDSDGGDGEED